MKNQRETYADMELFMASFKKISRANFDRAIPKIKFKGKVVDITEELIFLYALRKFKEHTSTNDWFWDMANELKDIHMDKKEASKLTRQVEEILAEFDDSGNMLLKSPDDILMLNHIRLTYLMYKLGYKRTEIYKQAVETALGYLQSSISSHKFATSDLYRYAQDDSICRMCIYATLAWIADDENKVPKERGIVKLIQKYEKNTLEEMLEDKELKFKDLYLEYKEMCTDDITDEQRDEYWESKREYILSDLGRLKAENFGIKDFKSISEIDNTLVLNYNRSVADSFVNCFDKWYNDITEVPDDKSREIIFNLIQRYLGDIDEVIAVETSHMISELISYLLLKTELKDTKEQNSKDIEKLREQNKLKVNKVKKDIENYKTQVEFCKDRANRLMKELSKTDKEAVMELESKLDKLNEENNQFKKKAEKHELESERLNNKIEQLEKEIRQLKRDKEEMDRELKEVNNKTLDTTPDETRFNFQSKEISSDVLYNAIKDKKILLVGGNKIHARIIERGYDNIELLRSDNVNITMHSGQKYDLVVIYTKLVSHSVVERIESELKNSDIPIIRFNQAGINTLLYTIFMYIHGGYDEAVGKYLL